MSPIPDGVIDAVRSATDLVDLISRYIPLRRSGNTFKANCPFHEEKTPSFHVWPETQTFKCFGCGKGGSAFHFLMERERMTFPEAVRFLANEAGIEIAPERGAEQVGQKEELYKTVEWACRFFELRLRSSVGQKAVDYCKARGITGESAREFRIGYAPEGWRNLADAARAEGIPDDHLVRTGLVRTGRQEPYDWFRDRLIFPIQDVRGRVVGFGGRAFGDDEPKYLNSPDTALFKKGSTLYALNIAREEVLSRRRLGVMEGYTDVIMAHQHGIRWVVAGLGTGLTKEHAGLVRRYADRVDLVYDADAAGRKAAERALDAFLVVDADVRVVELDGGLDPCEFILERGADAFLARMEQGREVFEFLVARAGERHDQKSLNGRIAAADDVLASVALTTNEVKRDLLILKVSEAFRVSEASVRDRLRIFASKGGVVATGAGVPPVAEVEEAPGERFLLEAVLGKPSLAPRMAADWPSDRFRHPAYRTIAAEVGALTAAGEESSPAAVAGRLADPDAGRILAEIVSEGFGRDGFRKSDFERQYEQCVARLEREARIREVREALARARAAGEEEDRRDLERELFRLRAGLT